MPDIEVLMQEWPAQFEASLKEIGLPLASLNCDLAQYADIICGKHCAAASSSRVTHAGLHLNSPPRHPSPPEQSALLACPLLSVLGVQELPGNPLHTDTVLFL